MSQPAWPSIEHQLTEARAAPGSALEKLIRDNQDFNLLRTEEANDKIGLPLWLRVLWRKNHPEGVYSADDPTGGYPRALHRVLGWMLTHQDLSPGPPSAPATPANPAAPAAPAAVTPRTAVGANLRISGAQTSPRSESDIRVDYINPNRIIAAANSSSFTPGTQAQFYSEDGGATWSQTSLPVAPIHPIDMLQSDPAVDWTSDGTAWATTIGFLIFIGFPLNLQLLAYRSTDGGATWAFDTTPSGNQTTADKPMMWVDHSPTSPFKDTIYVIWHGGDTGLPAFVNRRTGPAGAWQTPIQVSGAETTGTAIGGDIKTNSFGDVFAFWPDTGSQKLLVAKSTDGGITFAAPVTIATTYASFQIAVPSFANRQALIYISGGAYRTVTKNLVYATWVDLTGAAGCTSSGNVPSTNVASTCKTRVWFSRSTNGGNTWEAPKMINNQAPPPLNDQFHPRLVIDETDGKLVVIYYDTVGDQGRLKTDVWTQSSSDDGVTWRTPFKVTTAQTDETVTGADNSSGFWFGDQYGDYIGLSGYAGKFFPSWTDRRSGGREEIWIAPIITAAAPQLGVRSETSYAWPESSTQHVFYLGVDQHVHELWLDAVGVCHHNDLTAAAAGAPNAVSGSALTSYVWPESSTQHVFYLGVDQHVHELGWNQRGGWHHNDLTAAVDP